MSEFELGKALVLGCSTMWVIGLPMVLLVWGSWRGWVHTWSYPTNGNPYRRTCKTCGYCESYYTRSGSSNGWWEEQCAPVTGKHWWQELGKEGES